MMLLRVSIIFILLASCGVRKTDTNTAKSDVNTNIDISDATTLKVSEKTLNVEQSKTQIDKQEAETTRTTLNKFDGEGKISEQTITETVKFATDKTTHDNKNVYQKIRTVTETRLKTILIREKTTIKQKAKSTENSRAPINISILIIIISAGFAYYVLKYWRK